MRCPLTLAVVVALLLPAVVMAQVAKIGEQTPRVGVLYGRQTAVAISASAPVEVSSTAKYTDAFAIPRTMAHSVDLTLVSTQAITAAVEVQGSFDGTTFKSFGTAVTVSSAGSSYVTTSYDKIKSISLPACPFVRVKFTPDATGPNRYYTITKCDLGVW